MRIIRRSDVDKLLTMKDAVRLARESFTQLSSGKAIVPPRAAIQIANGTGVSLFMPGYLEDSGALAMKIVSVCDGNRELGLPLINAVVILTDAKTGMPLAAMDGGLITAVRTGASSGLATELLSRSDSQTAAIFGAGVQARTQLLAIAEVRPLKLAKVYSPTSTNAERLVDEIKDKLPGVELQPAKSPEDAIRNADVICTATTSAEPVFDGALIRPGTHINAVGSFKPHVREVDFTTLQRAALIAVDTIEGAFSESGELIQAVDGGHIPREKVATEIGEIALGIKAGRVSSEDITFFKSVGNAAQDAAVARFLYDQAVLQSIGTEIDLAG